MNVLLEIIIGSYLSICKGANDFVSDQYMQLMTIVLKLGSSFQILFKLYFLYL